MRLLCHGNDGQSETLEQNQYCQQLRFSRSSFPFPAPVKPRVGLLSGSLGQSISPLTIVLGEVYTMDSTMWTSSQSSLRGIFSLGPLPTSTFTLLVGQRSRSCQWNPSRHNHRDIRVKGSTVFSLTSCAVGPPSFTISLLSLSSKVVALQRLCSGQDRVRVDQEGELIRVRTLLFVCS